MEERDNQAHSSLSEPNRGMANAHRMIKASPFTNMELFPGLASVLTSWFVSAG